MNEAAGCLTPVLWSDRDGQSAPAEIALAAWHAAETRWDIADGFTFFATSRAGAAKGYELRTDRSALAT